MDHDDREYVNSPWVRWLVPRLAVACLIAAGFWTLGLIVQWLTN
jgi:hypothetical protein